MGGCRQLVGAHFLGFGLGTVACTLARGWLLVGHQSIALVLALGGSAQKPHVHLPLGQPYDLALFYRGRGARVGRQRLVSGLGHGRSCFVPHFVCRLRTAVRWRFQMAKDASPEEAPSAEARAT